MKWWSPVTQVLTLFSLKGFEVSGHEIEMKQWAQCNFPAAVCVALLRANQAGSWVLVPVPK